MPNNDHLPFDAKLVESIYHGEILNPIHALRRIVLLEFSQYLENYLWPNFDGDTSKHCHYMSIVFMANEKIRERVQLWPIFSEKPEHFTTFFRRVLEMCLPVDQEIQMPERTALLVFINHCFNSMEVELCRQQIKRLVSLSMWTCLQPSKVILK